MHRLAEHGSEGLQGQEGRAASGEPAVQPLARRDHEHGPQHDDARGLAQLGDLLGGARCSPTACSSKTMVVSSASASVAWGLGGSDDE